MAENLQCGQTFDSYKFMPETGYFSACCDAKAFAFNWREFDELKEKYFLEKVELVKRKHDLLCGVKNDDCAACWYKEEQGILSMRQYFAPVYKSAWPKYCRPENFTLNHACRVEIWNNNLCNYACFMCNAGDSATLGRIYGDEPDAFGGSAEGRANQIVTACYTAERKKKYLEYMIEFTKFAGLNRETRPQMTLAYLGGEPTLHQELHDQAPHFAPLAREARKEMQLDIVTNGSLDESRMKRLVQLYGYYKENGWKTCVMLSQDAVGPQSQVRFLSNTKRVQTNWKSFLNNPVLAKAISFTVLSNLNLPYIDQMAQFHWDSMEGFTRRDLQLDINFNSLDHPRWMQVEFLPRRYAEDAIEKADVIYRRLRDRWPFIEGFWGIFKSVTAALPETVPDEKAEFYFSELNRIQKIYNRQYPEFKFAQTFPHLAAYAKDYRKSHYLDS